MHFVEQNINFNKNATESKMKNPTYSFKRRTLYFNSYKNRKLKVKLWWVGAHKRKKRAFLYRLFCPKKFFLHLCFISMCSVLNTLSEYTYFSILLPFLHINIIKNLQCILFLFHVGCSQRFFYFESEMFLIRFFLGSRRTQDCFISTEYRKE